MKNKRLVKNFIYNTMYQILVLIAPLITTPYIARVLGVTNIGIYQYSQSIANYFVLVGAVGTTLYGQREIAYLQDKPKERSIAFWEIEILRIVTTLICVVVYYTLFGIHGAYQKIYSILSLEVLATAFDISWLYMGMEDFKITVIRNTVIKLIGIICVFLFVKGPGDLDIYTLCVTAPLFIGNISLWFSIKKYIVETGLTVSVLVSGIKHRLMPIFTLFLPQVATNVYLLLDKTMIGIFGSNIDEVGYYSQAQKIIQIVLTLVISLGTVMLPTMSALFAKGDNEGIRKSVRTAFQFIFSLSFPLMFGVCAVAPRFVPIFFGKGYDPVINLMIIISPILVIIAISNVIGKQFLLPTNQQKPFIISILAGASVNFILNIVLIRLWNAIGASIATVIAEITVTAIQCWYVKSQLPLKECLGSGVRYLCYGVFMFLICREVDIILPSGKIWPIFVIAVVGMIVYFLELVFTKDSMMRMGVKMLKNNKTKTEN